MSASKVRRSTADGLLLAPAGKGIDLVFWVFSFKQCHWGWHTTCYGSKGLVLNKSFWCSTILSCKGETNGEGNVTFRKMKIWLNMQKGWFNMRLGSLHIESDFKVKVTIKYLLSWRATLSLTLKWLSSQVVTTWIANKVETEASTIASRVIHMS
jgi:hypothetical protein